MAEVYQHEPLSMGWCLECHRDPAAQIRPKDAITDMSYLEDFSEDVRIDNPDPHEPDPKPSTEPDPAQQSPGETDADAPATPSPVPAKPEGEKPEGAQ